MTASAAGDSSPPSPHHAALPVDRGEIDRFVHALFSGLDPNGYVSLRAFRQARPKGEQDRPLHIEPIRLNLGLGPIIDAAVRIATRVSNGGEPAVFAPPVCTFTGRTGAKSSDVHEAPTLSVEIDQGNLQWITDGLSLIIGERPAIALHSGSQWIDPESGAVLPKGHLHWRLKRAARGAEQQRMLRRARDIATLIAGGDPTGAPQVHPLRWPGSWNRKSDPPIMATIVEENATAIDLAEALASLEDAAQASGIETPRNVPHLAQPDATPAEVAQIAEWLRWYPNVGLHWDDWTKVGLAVERLTGGSEAGFEVFRAWSEADPRYSPAATRARWEEIKGCPATWIGARFLRRMANEHGWREPEPPPSPKADPRSDPPDADHPDPDPRPRPPPKPGRILTGADFIARHVPPVWLIDGIVQRSRLYACTSLTGHGKTAVWLFNACMIQSARKIGQLEVFQGNVLFLAGENPADLEARMIGMARVYNLPHSRLPYVLPGSFPMTEEEADALKREIAGLSVPLALIVGDTASSFFPGDDENSNVQAGSYARTLRGFTEGCEGNPAVMVLSHPVKNASRGNLLPRGGGAFLNELDGNLAIWSNSPGEVTELHWCGKIRGPDFSAFGYRLRQVPTGLTDEKDRQEMTIVAEPMSEEAVADHAKQTLANEDIVLRSLRDQPGLSNVQIARNAGWIDEEDRPIRWKVQKAIASLARDKLIHQSRHGTPWKLTEKGEEALKEAGL